MLRAANGEGSRQLGWPAKAGEANTMGAEQIMEGEPHLQAELVGGEESAKEFMVRIHY